MRTENALYPTIFPTVAAMPVKAAKASYTRLIPPPNALKIKRLQRLIWPLNALSSDLASVISAPHTVETGHAPSLYCIVIAVFSSLLDPMKNCVFQTNEKTIYWVHGRPVRIQSKRADGTSAYPVCHCELAKQSKTSYKLLIITLLTIKNLTL